MKQDIILKVISKDLGTSNVVKLNEIFKAKTFKHIKYKLLGEKLGYLGYTVNIKNITQDGLKVFLVNKVKLIRYEDIEQFEKAKPRVERPVRPKRPEIKAKKKTVVVEKDNKSPMDSEVPQVSEEPKERLSVRRTSPQGSKYIPAKTR
jgi:hypothetical protein